MSPAQILEQIEQLPPTEQRVIAEVLWEKYGVGEDDLTPEQSAELDRRLAEFGEDPHDGIPWEQVEADLNKRFSWR